MTQPRRAVEIAAEAFEKHDEMRAEFIADACGDDAALRAEVEWAPWASFPDIARPMGRPRMLRLRWRRRRDQ